MWNLGSIDVKLHVSDGTPTQWEWFPLQCLYATQHYKRRKWLSMNLLNRTFLYTSRNTSATWLGSSSSYVSLIRVKAFNSWWLASSQLKVLWLNTLCSRRENPARALSPIGIRATPRVRDSPIWIQPRGVFRINPTPGSWMSKNYAIITQFAVPLTIWRRFIDRERR